MKLGTKVRRELLINLETREVYELANMDEMSPLMRAKYVSYSHLLAHDTWRNVV